MAENWQRIDGRQECVFSEQGREKDYAVNVFLAGWNNGFSDRGKRGSQDFVTAMKVQTFGESDGRQEPDSSVIG